MIIYNETHQIYWRILFILPNFLSWIWHLRNLYVSLPCIFQFYCRLSKVMNIKYRSLLRIWQQTFFLYLYIYTCMYINVGVFFFFSGILLAYVFYFVFIDVLKVSPLPSSGRYLILFSCFYPNNLCCCLKEIV